MDERTVKEEVKSIPYGMSNFVAIREDNYYYVDKTRFIEKVENSNRYFFFIRPRRFGKSLTISMLHHYYDINAADKFERLYGDTYIGKHPTPNHNKYLIIYLNFAVVNADLGNYRSALDEHCNTRFNSFCDTYASLLPENIKEELNKKNGCVAQLDYLYNECDRVGLKIYLFIDEYDHFTNNILSDAARLKEYQSETHGTGYLRTFFDTIKAGTDSSIARVFITGVSPVTLDDLTSGFNIGTNYSLAKGFNEMVGFTKQEVREMLTYYSQHYEFNHTIDELIEIMKPYYDNYCFALKAYGETTMYNSNMVLSFLFKYIDEGCELPQQMFEENIRVDYEKLRMLIRNFIEPHHYTSIIKPLISQDFVTGWLNERFSTLDLSDHDNFLSLMYFLGFVSIGGIYRGKVKFILPNEIVREQVMQL